ncbi:MAG: efflux RND transporter periplasmic adaptor subunit [Methylophilaceae bacterium]|nr:efflux RND transporter periplasmic adaptor subunit [Methylophilaceae bacterium]
MNPEANDPLRTIVDATPSPRRRLLRFAIAGCLLAALATLAWLYAGRGKGDTVHYVTEEVTRTRLVVTVSATGNLQPTNQVDLGSELSGTIEKVLVEENDRVKRGQVLAQLDLSKVHDQVARARAAVAAAEAEVAQAQATVAEARASLARLRQVAELSGGKVPSKTEMEAAEAAVLRAEAAEASARAAVGQAKAALNSEVTNIAKGTIRSPIDGIVLARKVEPGQTVAASLQAPVLFTIAEDLSKMELQVDVDEADVGQVRPGQPATFTVDAWPGRRYPATVTQVGFGAQTKDGVVSYKTLLKVNNDDLSLRPGMTATAEIVTSIREHVLVVPNAALRFSPPAPIERENPGLIASLLPRPPRDAQRKAPAAAGSPKVWVLREGKPVAVPVKTGLSNGHLTEILEGALEPGMRVITEVEKAKK